MRNLCCSNLPFSFAAVKWSAVRVVSLALPEIQICGRKKRKARPHLPQAGASLSMGLDFKNVYQFD